MFIPSADLKVYLVTGSTDMRKSINGLSILVEEYLELDPFSGHLFVFCNRSRNIIKILYWDRNGFCLWHKRLEKDNFKWPASEHEVLAADHRQLMLLIDGLDISIAESAHKRLLFESVC